MKHKPDHERLEEPVDLPKEAQQSARDLRKHGSSVQRVGSSQPRLQRRQKQLPAQKSKAVLPSRKEHADKSR